MPKPSSPPSSLVASSVALCRNSMNPRAPTPITAAADFNPEWTDPLFRPAFAVLANDEDFRRCTTLREQVL